MERLTNNITENFNGIKIKTNMIIPKNEVKSYDELEEWYQRCAEKLAYYEDLEESGKLIELPCMVGDTLYLLDHECTEGMKYNCEIDGIMEGYLCRNCGTYPCTLHPSVQEVVVESILITEDNTITINLKDLREVFLNDFNVKVFLTRDEAKEKLKEMENE